MKRSVVLVLLLGACSGAAADTSNGVASLSGDTITDTTVAAEVDTEAALIAFTDCLREQGIDIGDPIVDANGNVRPGRPTFPEGGPDEGFRETITAARDACGKYLEGVTLGFSQRDSTEFEDMLLEFAACMREEGIDTPDPDFSAAAGPGGGGPGRGIFGGSIDPSDPAVQEALEACGDVLAGFGFGGGPGGGGQGG